MVARVFAFQSLSTARCSVSVGPFGADVTDGIVWGFLYTSNTRKYRKILFWLKLHGLNRATDRPLKCFVK